MVLNSETKALKETEYLTSISEKTGENYCVLWGLLKMLSMRPDKLQTIIKMSGRNL